MNKFTLCWGCRNACGGCSWSDYWLQKPVRGWTAEKVGLRMDNDRNGTSYIVTDCPEFEPDPPRPKIQEPTAKRPGRKKCKKQG